MGEAYEDLLPEKRAQSLEGLYQRQLVLKASQDPIRNARELLALEIVIRQKEHEETKAKDDALICAAEKSNRNAWISAAASVVSAFVALVAVLLGK